MDFYQMKQILTIAQTGSISEAAKLLCVSQPAVSHALAKAEQEFHTPLFDRTRYPLKPTHAGEQYIEAARKMLLIYSDLEKKCLDAAQGAGGQLRLGIPYNRSAQILPAIIKEYRQMFPNVCLSYQTGPILDMKEKLYSGSVDLLIFTQLENDLRFRYEPLFEEELFAVSAQDIVQSAHLEPGSSNILRLSALSQLPVLAAAPRSGLGTMFRLLMEYYNIVPNVTLTVSGNNALYTLAEAGLGVVILPANVIRQSAPSPRLRLYSLSGRGIGWRVCAIFRRDAYISGAEQALLTLIRNKFAAADGQLDLFPPLAAGGD